MSAIQATIQELEGKIEQLTEAVRILRGIEEDEPVGLARTRAAVSAAKGGRKKVARYWSPASRKAAALRMKKYWADRRKAKGK
jgi:hypothetical protein